MPKAAPQPHTSSESGSVRESTAVRALHSEPAPRPLTDRQRLPGILSRAKLGMSALAAAEIRTLQRTIGNQAVLRLIASGRNIQRQPSPPTPEPASASGADRVCSGDQSVLVYKEKSAETACISENEFEGNYIDNNIQFATGLALPETYWGNIDDDRIPTMKLTYKDGRTLLLEVKDIPLQTAADTGIREGQTRVNRPFLYERRSDGLIYPMRGEEKWRSVSYADADNIMSLRAGLHATIKELQAGFTLIEITSIFASQIAALGDIAALNHSFESGGLFEPVPRKGKSRVGADDPGSERGTEPPEPNSTSGGGGRRPQKLLDQKRITITSDEDPRSAKLAGRTKTPPKTVYEVKKASTNPSDQAEVRMAEHFAENGHEVHFRAHDAGGDLLVDNVRTDVKLLTKPDAIASAIERGRGQGEQVILDGTAIKLTEEQAIAGIRAHEEIAAQHPGKFRDLKAIFIVEGDGKIYFYHRSGAPLKVERIGVQRLMALSSGQPPADQTPDDWGPVNLPPITVAGQPKDFRMEGGCDGLVLHGVTQGTFNGGVGRVENQVATKGKNCSCEEGVQCLHLTGTLVTSYSVSVSISMPSVPSGLSDCERAKVRDWLKNVLGPHELEHKRRMLTYQGQTRNPIDLTGCGKDDITSQLQAIQGAEDDARKAAATALSDAIDPFNSPIECSACHKDAGAKTSDSGTEGSSGDDDAPAYA